MNEVPLLAPQLIVNSRMLYYTWVVEDPEGLASLVPQGLTSTGIAFINQYIVDRPEQTSGFGAYSLTYTGSNLAGLDLADGTPGRWWTHYFNSSPRMIAYAKERGIPASSGETSLGISEGRLVATTSIGGRPVIRSTARVGEAGGTVARGQLRYLTEVDGKLVSGLYPYVAELVEPFEVLSLEFLDKDHSVYALRPKEPLEVTFGFYSPRISFCYPGGEETL